MDLITIENQTFELLKFVSVKYGIVSNILKYNIEFQGSFKICIENYIEFNIYLEIDIKDLSIRKIQNVLLHNFEGDFKIKGIVDKFNKHTNQNHLFNTYNQWKYIVSIISIE